MALYKTHTKFNLFLALPILLFCCIYFLHPKTSLTTTFGGSFVYATLFMSPDADISNKNKLFSIKGFFTLPFRIYSKFFSHRGISHSLFLGTLTRVLFLTFLFLGILFLCHQALPSKSEYLSFWRMYKEYIIFGFSGLFLADVCHLLLDYK